MTLRKAIMLAGIGGFIYAHRKRGGEWSLDSFKDTARELVDSGKSRANELRSKAENRIQDVVGQVKDDIKGRHQATGVEEGGQFSEDVTGYGSSGYGYSR
jgi:hypothetical protein